MRQYIFLALSLFGFAAVGQDKLDIIDVDDINNSIALKSQERDYEGALEILRKINKNDTIYPSSLIRKSYYLMALERHDDAIAALDEGLTMDIGDLKSSLYQNKGVAFTHQEKFEKAIATLDEGLEIFPANHLLLFNKAVALQGNGQLKEAVKILEQVIAISPFYAKGYIQLGSIYYSQQRPAQALMAFNLGLMMEPDGESSFSRLRYINSIFSTKNENKRAPNLLLSKDDPAFDDIDLIISNQIALNKDYKVNNEIDIALVRQNHALMLKLQDFKGNNGFWSKKMVPFYQWVQRSNYFNPFNYTVAYSIENEKYKNILNKKTKEVTEFLKLAIPYWTNITKTDNPHLFNGQNVQYLYNNNSLTLMGMGAMDGEKQVGDWTYFNDQGRMVTKAQYDKEGERSGDWEWYHDQSTLKELASFKNDKLNGENKIFYPNGQLSIKTYYKDGELHGEFLYYNEKGALEQKKHFKDGKLVDTYTSYYEVGEELPRFIIPYKADKVQDKATEYFANGKIYSEIPFKDGERHGVEKTFYQNGKVSNEVTHVDGKLQGPYKSYFPDGKISETGTYKDGLLQGPYATYYSDGTLQSEANYMNGSLDGAYTYYDYDGKIYYTYNYRKGDIVDYRFFNKKGAILKEGKKRGGEFYYNGFAANGNLTSEGLYDVSGGRKGEWRYYGPDGNLTEKGTFENDLTQGTYTSYYPNGTTRWIANYKNDTLVGYFANYHKNGKIENQGGYKNGLQQGEWRFYYIDGSLKSINFFHKGEFHGEQEYFAPDGSLASLAQYDRDNILSETFHDQNGNEFQKIEYRPSKRDTVLISKHYNGKIRNKTTYIHGIKHGAFSSYYFDGTLESEGKYLNNSPHGPWAWYFESGKPQNKATYVLGKLDGEMTGYYENGQIEDSNFYYQGDPVGLWKSYYEDGTLHTQTSYLEGKAHGRKEFYGPSGKLQLIRFYDHGTLIGYSYNDKNGAELPMIPIVNETAKIIAYYDNGRISREFEYINGQQIGTYKTYYYEGQLKDEFVNENNEYQGPKITYYKNGKIKERKEYLFGEPHGKHTKYYEDGTLKEEASYNNGIQVGNATSYDKTGKKTKSEDYFNGNIYTQQIF